MATATSLFTGGTPSSNISTNDTRWVQVRGDVSLLHDGSGNCYYSGSGTTGTIYKYTNGAGALSGSAVDSEVEVQLTSVNYVSSGVEVHLPLRIVDSNNYYYAQFIKDGTNNYAIKVRKRYLGSLSDVGSMTSGGQWTGTSKLKFRATGTTTTSFKVFVDDVEITAAACSDSTNPITSGAVGLGGFSNGASNNWYATSWYGDDDYVGASAAVISTVRTRQQLAFGSAVRRF